MDDQDRAAVPATDLEQDSCHAPLAAKDVKGLDTRVHIRVISYRKRKHDPDGVSVKAVLDGLTRAGILADDSTEQIKGVSFESIQSDEEKTVIEIDA